MPKSLMITEGRAVLVCFAIAGTNLQFNTGNCCYSLAEIMMAIGAVKNTPISCNTF